MDDSDATIDEVLQLLQDVRRNGFDVSIPDPEHIPLTLEYHGLMVRSNAHTLTRSFYSYREAADALREILDLSSFLNNLQSQPSSRERILELINRAQEDEILLHTLMDFIISNPPPGLMRIFREAGLDPSILRSGGMPRDTGPVARIIRPTKIQRKEVPAERRKFEYENWVRVGADMERRGEPERAEQAYFKATKINPEGKEAKQALKRLQSQK
jgi:hypothetical protein